MKTIMDEQQEIEMQVFRLFKSGEIIEAQKLFEEANMDYLEVFDGDKSNWLHEFLVGFDPTRPPRKTIEFFISKGVPINAQDKYGMTPLHYAMRGKNAECALALLKAGADPNIPDRDNIRPISMIGYLPERLDILQVMLDKGANVDNEINDNQTILESYLNLNLSIYNVMKKYSNKS